MNRRLLLGPALATLLAGCTTAPKPLAGEFTSSHPAQAATQGERVRWGGRIISVEPEAERTCFQVLSHTLRSDARPRTGDEHHGRFLACRAGFYDPAVFTDGRVITVVGRLAGQEDRRIGEYDYPLPRLDAEVIYLWPERRDDAYAYQPYPLWPHFYGWYRPYGSFHYYRPWPRARMAMPPEKPDAP